MHFRELMLWSELNFPDYGFGFGKLTLASQDDRCINMHGALDVLSGTGCPCTPC